MDNILYHYTNFDILESILKYDTVKNKEICFWASRYDCFKDGEEFKYGLEWIKSTLLDHENSLGRPKEDQIADFFEPSIVLSNPSLPKPFVVSLTVRPDDEYMWQSYTKGKDVGMVLELNLNDELMNIATVDNKQFFLSLCNCLYDLPELEIWNLINFQYCYYVYAGNIGNSVPKFFCLFHALALLLFFCPRIKQANYKKENETRLILGVPDLEWCNIFTEKSEELGVSKEQIIEGLKKFSGNRMVNVNSKDIEQYVSDIHQNPHNDKWYKELFLPKAALKGIYVRNENLIDKIKEILVSKNLKDIPVHLVERCY
ncbi:hypothetical protein [Odoribacter laneus]|uniref:hypothetical protein n=1 Tax=Odoribacter laneus TaxID=626933 RepID=UPI0023F0243A|nr:hypothetical protein [Odoribacter laneus]